MGSKAYTDKNTTKRPQYGLVNISDYALSPAETSLLKKGLLFIPTPPQTNHTLVPSISSITQANIDVLRERDTKENTNSPIGHKGFSIAVLKALSMN